MESPGKSRGRSDDSSERTSFDSCEELTDLKDFISTIHDEFKSKQREYGEKLETLKEKFSLPDPSTKKLLSLLLDPIDGILHNNVEETQNLITLSEHLTSLQETTSKLKDKGVEVRDYYRFFLKTTKKKKQIIKAKCKVFDNMMKTLHTVVDERSGDELKSGADMGRLVEKFAEKYMSALTKADKKKEEALYFAFKEMLKKDSLLKEIRLIDYFLDLEGNHTERLKTIRYHFTEEGMRELEQGFAEWVKNGRRKRDYQRAFLCLEPEGPAGGSRKKKGPDGGDGKGVGGGKEEGAVGGGKKGAGGGKEKKDGREKEKEAAGPKGKEARASFDNLGDYADALKEACQKTAPPLEKPNLWISGIFLNEFFGFRNSTYVPLDSEAPVNCIIGPSGEGKTTIFRAIEMVWHIHFSQTDSNCNEEELEKAVTARGAKDATICVLLRVIHEKTQTAYIIGFRKRKEGPKWNELERVFINCRLESNSDDHNEKAMQKYMKMDHQEKTSRSVQELKAVLEKGEKHKQSLGVVSQDHSDASKSRWSSCNEPGGSSRIVISQEFINERLSKAVNTEFRKKLFHRDTLKRAAVKSLNDFGDMGKWCFDILKPSSKTIEEDTSSDMKLEDHGRDDYALCERIINFTNEESDETKSSLFDALMSRLSDSDSILKKLQKYGNLDCHTVKNALPRLYKRYGKGCDPVAWNLMRFFWKSPCEEAIIFLVENYVKIDKNIKKYLQGTYKGSADVVDYDHLWRQGDLLLVLKITYGKACNEIECTPRGIPRLDETQELLALRNMQKAGMETKVLISWCRTWSGESSELHEGESSELPEGESSELHEGEPSESLAGELSKLLARESSKSVRLLNAIRDMARCAIVPQETNPKNVWIQHAESSAKVSLESCSSGQYDCLSALVGAFYCDIILLDEPGQNMGPSERILLRTTLEQWAREHAKQVVIITHHPELLDRANPLSGVLRTTISQGTVSVCCVKKMLRVELVDKIQGDLRTRQALLFARKAILVEGESDVLFAEEMIREKKIMCNVIQCCGRDGVARMKWMCDILNIRNVAFLDVDVLFDSTGGHLALALPEDKSKRTVRLANDTLKLLLGESSSQGKHSLPLIDSEFEEKLHASADIWNTLKIKTQELIDELHKNNVIVWPPELCDIEGWVVPSREVGREYMRDEFTEYQADGSDVRLWPMDYVANLAGHYITTRSPDAFKRLKGATKRSKIGLYGSLIIDPDICETLLTAKQDHAVWSIVGEEKRRIKDRLLGEEEGICKMLGGHS